MSGPGAAATAPRRAAYEVLRRVFEHDAWADRAFPAAAERHGLDARERAQAQRLAYGAVQRRGTSDHFIASLTRRKLTGLDGAVLASLRLGLFEILFSETADHAAVDGAVELAKTGMRHGGSRRAAGASGLVNAVLRRAATERDDLVASMSEETPADAAVAHSVPVWLAEMWWEELGAESARSLLGSLNEPPETVMRANTLRTTPDALRANLEASGEPLAPSGDDGLLDPPESVRWIGPLGEAALGALGEGLMFAQSRGAQAVVGVLDPRPGERVLDLCAGPGIKTTAIAARMKGEGEVVAVEQDAGRARQVSELAERAGADNVRVLLADASGRLGGYPDGQGYDRVLVDPPCSDLGTFASRPDARWRKDPATIERLVGIQGAILGTGVAALRPGGTLVYSTCTISVRENEEVIAAALASNPGVECAQRLEVRPDRDGTDGFFIAGLRKADPGV
ncbi:MAG: transcription antitermination factor NusB [Solirubrobacterales bacterium]